MLSSNGVYAVERGQVVDNDFSSELAAGGIFSNDFKKNERIKAMLDSNKDGLKLEAMKLIIGMVAKGKDASDLFPAVVKNVVSKNIEVKKLVYVYLVRYAEEQQDLALLSISTFQRALKDPNQLIRASALRVLSSIRVPVIVPIMMLAIKDAVNDMSPYVRKTAAHAIPKLYSLDPEQKDQLIEVIEKLLSDKTTLVVGSAAMSFEEVCPERMDLLHRNYRKLCGLLVDVEEWGQVVILDMLTRYARTQFLDPNSNKKISNYEPDDEDKPFYDEEEWDESTKGFKEKDYQIDQDHRLLLRNSKPLLQSRNAAVVMAVAKLYVYLAPVNEISIIAKALIRLMHGHREIQSVVLSNILSLSQTRKSMFSPYLKSFFVRSSDPTHIKVLKLDIMVNLATETNISLILKEFQTYISFPDMQFVAATIQAIGACACSIKEVSDTCLSGLVALLSNKNETVVAESVVVIKKLLQMQASDHHEIIGAMVRLMDNLAVGMARASILWLAGEYSADRLAPDVLRKVAKSFPTEDSVVKLQALGLAAKLLSGGPGKATLLAQYVFNLAKYDSNYDIRDRARFLRHLLLDNSAPTIGRHAASILLNTRKTHPLGPTRPAERQNNFQLGSLSHYLRMRANGYQELPDFPEEAPDPSVRHVPEAVPSPPPQPWEPLGGGKPLASRSHAPASPAALFYSDKSEDSSPSEEEEEEDEEETESGSGSEEEESSSGQSSSEEESGSESSDSEASSTDNAKKSAPLPPKKLPASINKTSQPTKKPVTKPKASDDLLLLDLNDFSVPGAESLMPTQTPLAPLSYTAPISSTPQVAAPQYVSTVHKDLLSRGTLSVGYRFTRSPNLYSAYLTNIELQLRNTGSESITGISVLDSSSGAVPIHGFPALGALGPGAALTAAIGAEFNDSPGQPAILTLRFEDGQEHTVSLKCPAGELVRPLALGEPEYCREQAKLRGLTENTLTVELAPHLTGDSAALKAAVYKVANLLEVSSLDSSCLRFAGQTIGSGTLVLASVRPLDGTKAAITVNCDKMVVGSMLLKELKDSLTSS